MGHLRITSPDNSLYSSSLCVFTGSVFVQPDAPTLLRSERGGGGQDEEGGRPPSAGDAPPPLLLSSWPASRPWWRVRSRCVEATRLPLKRLAIYSPLIVGAAVVKSNAESYFTVFPSLFSGRGFTVQKVIISVLAPHLMDTSPWSNYVQVFCLIYSCIRLCCGLWRRQAVRQLPLWPTSLVCPV